ncbi:MAG: amidohydrolase family protein [Longimicrobiales bacterium]
MSAPRAFVLLLSALLVPAAGGAQQRILVPDRVFDGERMHDGWRVLIVGDRIAAAGPDAGAGSDAEVIALPGTTLLPGLIEGHSHLLLHPYDETPWDEQVLREPRAYRVAAATAHARATLLAGFTTVRDLGTEGAGYADVGLKRAIADRVIPGPRMIVTTRAIVATGSYGPRGFAPHVTVPLGAEVADGTAELTRVVRDQIGKGADWIKVYADYRWGPNGEARPTFSEAELRTIVDVAAASGRSVAAHAATAEGMRRAALAGVRTIEHGDAATADVLALMAERNVAYCPTLAAVDAIARYGGWDGREPAPARLLRKRETFLAALAAGVPICVGGDVGVYAHGTNAREIVLMVEAGMAPIDALRAATSGNARLFAIADSLGHVRAGHIADLTIVDGDPATAIEALYDVRAVFKAGQVVCGLEHARVAATCLRRATSD